jgi:hypothetical protein
LVLIQKQRDSGYRKGTFMFGKKTRQLKQALTLLSQTGQKLAETTALLRQAIENGKDWQNIAERWQRLAEAKVEESKPVLKSVAKLIEFPSATPMQVS